MIYKRKEVIGDCTLYLGDAADLIPAIEIDAVVTDPPYGIGASRMSFGKWRTSRMVKSGWDDQAPELEEVLALAVPSIIWGANNFVLPPSRAYLVWDKGAGFKGRDFAECEMAWCSFDGNARVFSYDPLARGAYKDKMHPTQKPLELMKWCLGFVQGSVLDPYMGSGTTGVACASLGRKFVGVEIDENYFAVACERIRKAYSEPDIFVEAMKQAEQVGMDFALPQPD